MSQGNREQPENEEAEIYPLVCARCDSWFIQEIENNDYCKSCNHILDKEEKED